MTGNIGNAHKKHQTDNIAYVYRRPLINELL